MYFAVFVCNFAIMYPIDKPQNLSHSNFTLNIKGKLYPLDQPKIMGIVNVTPDSFYANSRTTTRDSVKRRVEQMLTEGADMLDIGAYSSRPGADDVSSEMELERLSLGMEALTEAAGKDIPVSVDTFRADVAKEAVTNLGCSIINDISGGSLDPQMWSTVAELGVPYILMHMRGTPATMQSMTDYSAWNGDVTAGVIAELSRKVTELRHMGVADIIIDPGFGFSKTVEQNYRLINSMEHIADLFHAPLLVGISRKSMIYKPLGITPAEALNGTTALHVIALMHGAAILRVHDVKAAREALTIFELAEQNL